MLLCRLVRFVAVAILSLEASNTLRRTDGLSLKKVVNRAVAKIPDAWKRDPTTGQPVACKAIEGTVKVATKLVLLGGSSKSPSEVTVEAKSNRDAFRGNLNKLSISVRDSKSPMGLLEVERLDVVGSNLKLGWTPLVTTAGIPLAIFVPPVRASLWTLSVYFYLWTVVRRLAKRVAGSEDARTASAASSIEQRMEATQAYVNGFRKKIMGGSPSQLRFEMVLSNENLLNSFLLRQSSKLLLTFLMKNSVLQTAAILGDAVSDAQKPPETPSRNQLPPASDNLALIPQQQQPSSRGDSTNGESNPKSKLSKLLSATAFELREAPTFQSEDGKNHLQFVSVAILPDNQARLEFVLRTTLKAGGDRAWLLQFVHPECRFDMTEATSSLPLPKVVSNLLPKVLWLPIGSGVAIGGGNDATSRRSGGLSIRDIDVVPGGKCEIRGSFSLLTNPPSSIGGLVRR